MLIQEGVEEAEVEAIFNGIDQDHSNAIDYSEFLAATMQKRTYMDEERLHDAFHALDLSGSGYITEKDLSALLGDSYNVPDTHAFMQDAPIDENGRLSFENFVKMMRDDVKEVTARGKSASRLKRRPSLAAKKHKERELPV